jgi:hypothetical protein
MSKLYVQCAHCGKVTKGGRKPRGGDGSLVYPRLHINGMRDCPGSFEEGIISESKEVNRAISLREEPQERVYSQAEAIQIYEDAFLQGNYCEAGDKFLTAVRYFKTKFNREL